MSETESRPATRAKGSRSGDARPDTNGRGPGPRVPRVTIELTVNGARRRFTAPPMTRLLDALREELRLPGTKEGCGEGECGACTVLMNGRSVCACLVPVVQARGAKILTVEGLARRGRLSTLQQQFVELGAAQCGICTPGMLVTSMELLAECRGRVPSEDEVREALAGNLCRCTGYQKIVDAVRATARLQRAPSRRAGAGRRTRASSKPRGAAARARARGAAATTRRRASRGRR